MGIRFLQRRKKANENSDKTSKSGKNEKTNQKVLLEFSDDEDDDILTVKRKDHEIQDEDVPIEPLEIGENKVKVVTKASIAKKILKKNIQANQKTLFNEEGEATIDGLSQKKSQEGQDYDQDQQGDGGIDLEKAKKVLKAEDKFDKQLKKEQKKAKK